MSLLQALVEMMIEMPMITTLTAASCAVEAIAALREGAWTVSALQDYFPQMAERMELAGKS